MITEWKGLKWNEDLRLQLLSQGASIGTERLGLGCIDCEFNLDLRR